MVLTAPRKVTVVKPVKPLHIWDGIFSTSSPNSKELMLCSPSKGLPPNEKSAYVLIFHLTDAR